MTLDNFIKGLEILRRYMTGKNGGYTIGAEHDQFFVYATDRPLQPDDARALKELGWYQPEVAQEDVYNPAEGWCANT